MPDPYEYADTPSIIFDDITRVGNDRKLKYSDLTAREKCDYLFEKGIRKTAYDQKPDVVGGIAHFLQSASVSYAGKALRESLLRVSDELETPKRKLFHTYGTTAKVIFTPAPDTPYTGLYSDTAYGLARFSYAGPAIAVGIVPGLGLKFPIDGDHPSENMVVMRKLDRQQPQGVSSAHSHASVFQNPFTNILPLPAWTNIIMRIVRQRFETVNAAGKGLHQSVDNLARIHVNGNAVEHDQVHSPYRLIFRPTRQAKERSNAEIDFRDDLATNITAGTPIYEVFALSEAQEVVLNAQNGLSVEALLDGATRIGTVTTDSEFIASKYGDYRLFFKHSDRFIRH
jgi:hypothetical protein